MKAVMATTVSPEFVLDIINTQKPFIESMNEVGSFNVALPLTLSPGPNLMLD